MRRQTEFRDLLDRVYGGDEEREAFHGPCLRAVLERVDPERAADPPAVGTHSIYELVLHLVLWRELIVERVAFRVEHPDTPLEPTTLEGDWEPQRGRSAEDWRALLARLDATQDRLLELVPRLTDGGFAEREHTLHFALHHDLHHGGQIGLLVRAAAPS